MRAARMLASERHHASHARAPSCTRHGCCAWLAAAALRHARPGACRSFQKQIRLQRRSATVLCCRARATERAALQHLRGPAHRLRGLHPHQEARCHQAHGAHLRPLRCAASRSTGRVSGRCRPPHQHSASRHWTLSCACTRTRRWQSPPFELRVEQEEGYFYGRGVDDDKGGLLQALHVSVPVRAALCGHARSQCGQA